MFTADLKTILCFTVESPFSCRVVKKKYRLACLKSMPPEECYERKVCVYMQDGGKARLYYMIMLNNYTQMQNEEYGEALALAQQYNLDCDLVYQTQWKTHPISIATIQDYLVKDILNCIPCSLV